MNPTKIEWVLGPDGSSGFSWNPVTGCLGPGGEGACPYCYAKKVAETRLAGRYGYPKEEPFKPCFHADKLDDPVKRSKAAGIFCCDMSDLFGSWVPEEWIVDILEVIHDTPEHIYYMLTKNPARYKDFVDLWPKNAWAGATIDKNSEFKRNTDLTRFKLELEARRGWTPITYLSIEPMLTPMPNLILAQRDWIIIGGLTKSNYREPGYPLESGKRPPDHEWVMELIDEAAEFSIPVFMKENLPWSGERRKGHPLTLHRAAATI